MASGFELLDRLCREHGVGLVYLFGSQQEAALRLLGGENVALPDRLADVDVGVVLADPLPGPDERYRLYARLYNAFSDLFRGVPLDLVLLEENHAVFQAQAVAGRCVWAVSDAYRESYEARVLARAADFRPVLELFYRERLEEAGR